MASTSSTTSFPINYKRRACSDVAIGGLYLGASYPIRVQTMADVATDDVHAAVEQAQLVARSGADYFRFTAQGLAQAKALGKIKEELIRRDFAIPLIADIHFNPSVAFEALSYVEKVRINPGNFAELKPFSTESEVDYHKRATTHLKQKFDLFLDKAKRFQRAIRIGTNHGSLSQRMLHQWGNTPQGMVESALEYLRLCYQFGFYQVVLSMKSSNVLVMTQAVRLLVEQMNREMIPMPLHLGVTEAGESEDGRVKSAVGIGSLLADGIGDTIRVSLSEHPVEELPVARNIIAHIHSRRDAPPILPYLVEEERQRKIVPYRNTKLLSKDATSAVFPLFVQGDTSGEPLDGDLQDILLTNEDSFSEAFAKHFPHRPRLLVLRANQISEAQLQSLASASEDKAILLLAPHPNRIGHWRNALSLLALYKLDIPIILGFESDERDAEKLLIEASIDIGSLLLEGWADAVALFAPHHTVTSLYRLGLSILQAVRIRFSHTEFISCPGCGRTLFDLKSTVTSVKQSLGHLKNLKIAVMGCIVNGPGEMADADYGYVGGSPGKIDLYKGHTLMQRGIEQDRAVEALIALLKAEGDWVDP